METYVRDGNMALRRALALPLEGLATTQGRILEAGCGSGRFLRAIRRHHPELAAFGCDINRAALAIGHDFGDGIAYAQASMTHLPYADASFDAVVVFDVLEHVAQADLALSELRRVLRPGGLLHALVPCEGQPLTLHWALWRLNLLATLKERHAGHVQRFTHAGLRAALDHAGFDVVSWDYSMHPLGQAKDILSYTLKEPWARPLDNPATRAISGALWVGAYVESSLLRRVGLAAVAAHVTARRR